MTNTKDQNVLSDRFPEALIFAERLHREQTRKGNDIPYVAHLLTVSATVLEWGGDEDCAIAALLHDAAEDQGGLPTLAEIEARFGARVARIVRSCSDSLQDPGSAKAPWAERKRTHLNELAHADADVARVTAADKLHNLTCMIRDIRRDGPPTMSRFNATPEQQVWYFSSIATALAGHKKICPVEEIERNVQELAMLLGLENNWRTKDAREGGNYEG